LLPLAELAVAIALIPTDTAWWGALGALALLLLFAAGISASLARGKKPDCHCFGQLHSAPAGWSTLARNGLLAVLSGLVVWQGWEGDAGPSAISWLWALSDAQLVALLGGLVLVGLVGSQWWFMAHLLGQNGRLLVRLEALEAMLGTDSEVPSQNGTQRAVGLPVGAPAPTFGLSGLHGETITLEALRAAGKPVVLLFTDPNCGPCTALLPEVRRWQRDHAEKLTVSLISRGTLEENRAKSTEQGLRGVLLQDDWEIAQAYQAPGTPSAVIVMPDGTIGSPVTSGVEALGSLVAYAVGERAQLPLMRPQAARGEPCPNCGKAHPTNGHAQQGMPPSLEVGESVPEVKLEDLEGETVELKDFRGEEVMVLFWNPGCGFCQQMLPDLKALEEADPAEGAPRILVVSAGTLEANKGMGLSSPVLIDQDFAVGRAFGVGGTPSARLVDEEGKIASEVAVGAQAVLGLARAEQAPA
jgi:peroxiredoxin